MRGIGTLHFKKGEGRGRGTLRWDARFLQNAKKKDERGSFIGKRGKKREGEGRRLFLSS